MEAMNNVEMHRSICEQLNKIYEQKNHDYGDSFHDTFIEEGMAMARIRLSDKLNRFKRLTKLSERGDGGEQKVADESIEDTLLDLANYAIMTVMEMRREATGELAEALTKLHVANSGPTFCNACGVELEKSVNGRNTLVCPKCGKVY